MVVVVIDVVYPFLVFSDLTCHLDEIETGVFDCTVPPDIKETKLGSSNQEDSLSADENIGVVLVPWCARKCGPTAISGGVDIPKVPGCHLLQQIVLIERHKNCFEDKSLI